MQKRISFHLNSTDPQFLVKRRNVPLKLLLHIQHVCKEEEVDTNHTLLNKGNEIDSTREEDKGKVH